MCKSKFQEMIPTYPMFYNCAIMQPILALMDWRQGFLYYLNDIRKVSGSTFILSRANVKEALLK
jgi:hypothetical protein